MTAIRKHTSGNLALAFSRSTWEICFGEHFGPTCVSRALSNRKIYRTVRETYEWSVWRKVCARAVDST